MLAGEENTIDAFALSGSALVITGAAGVVLGVTLTAFDGVLPRELWAITTQL